MNLLYFILTWAILTADLSACSRIFWNSSSYKISGRTMDLNVNDQPEFIFSPRGITRSGKTEQNPMTWISKYGTLVIAAFEGNGISEGMNEKGLAAHILYLDDTQYELRDQRPGLSNVLWVQYILDQCATVNEALSSFCFFQIVATEVAGRLWPLHLCLEDSSGDSAIIQYLEGKMSLHHGSEYLVLTNGPSYTTQIQNLQNYRDFGGDRPLPVESDSMSRFVRCTASLKTLPNPKSAREAIYGALSVMRSVKISYSKENPYGSFSDNSWPTRWISVLDLTNQSYYFSSTSNQNIFWATLKNLDFSSKQKIRRLNLQDLALKGDISKKLRSPA